MKKVLIGNQEYIYKKDCNGETILSRNDKIGYRNIEIILRRCSDRDAKDVEKFVMDVLSDLYIISKESDINEKNNLCYGKLG